MSSTGSSAHRSAVRRSCQTIALCTGKPESRSHSSVVSRWFVIESADGCSPAVAIAWAAAVSTVCQISAGSCSTQPGRGKCCGNSA